jgi:hypothetical protein
MNLKRIVCILLGKCEYCGGQLEAWSAEKSFCLKCKKECK